MTRRFAQMAPTVRPSGEVASEDALAIEVDAPAAARTLAHLAPEVETIHPSRRAVGLCPGVEVTHAPKVGTGGVRELTSLDQPIGEIDADG